MCTVDRWAAAEAARSAAEAEGDLAGQASAHLGLTAPHWYQDRYPPAIEHCRRASALARQAGWARGHAVALANLVSTVDTVAAVSTVDG